MRITVVFTGSDLITANHLTCWIISWF